MLKTIAFFTPAMVIGGASLYVINKAVWLSQHGYNVVIFSKGGEWVDRLPNSITHIKIEGIEDFPYNLRKNDVNKIIESIVISLKKYNIDLIEGYEMSPIVYAVLAQKFIKVPVLLNVLTEAAYQSFGCRILLGSVTKIMHNHGLYFTYHNDANVFIEKHLHCRFSNCKIIRLPVVYNKTLITRRDKYILTVCRMAPEKMYVKCLMDDFASLIIDQKIDCDYQLIVVGDGPLFNEVQVKANNLNKMMKSENIIMKGFCQGLELDELYAHCNICVGHATALLTGAMYGKPSVVSYALETPYIYGIFGFDTNDIGSFFLNRKKERFKDAIEHLLHDDDFYNKCGYAAQRTALINYDIDNIMEKWVKEYKTIYNNHLLICSYKKIYFRYRILRLLYVIFHKPWFFIKKIVEYRAKGRLSQWRHSNSKLDTNHTNHTNINT